MPKRPLKLVPPATIPTEPPLILGEAGMSLWKRLLSEYMVGNAGVREALAQICQAADRVEALRVRINADGELVDGKEHPLLKAEIATRGYITRALRQLLPSEAKRPVGRPPMQMGWSGR